MQNRRKEPENRRKEPENRRKEPENRRKEADTIYAKRVQIIIIIIIIIIANVPINKICPMNFPDS